MIELLQGLKLLHFAVVMLAGVGFFVFWSRTKWLPTYIHVLAFFGWLMGVGVALTAREDAAINDYGLIGKALVALIFPALVYFFFILYGGQAAAYRSRLKKSPMCPNCQKSMDVRKLAGSSEFEYRCRYCGRTLPATGT